MTWPSACSDRTTCRSVSEWQKGYETTNHWWAKVHLESGGNEYTTMPLEIHIHLNSLSRTSEGAR
jgi:hypothetical protein